MFSQMPWMLKQRIVNSTDTPTKLELTRCSKELKEHVSNTKLTYFQLSFRYAVYDRISVGLKRTWLDEESVEFVRCESGEGYVKQLGDTKTLVEDGDFIHAAVEQFMKILKAENTKLDYLSVTLENPSRWFKWHLMQRLTQSFEGLGHLISVGALYMETDGNSEDVALILKHLQPGTLRRITLLTPVPDVDPDEDSEEIEAPIINLSEIVKMNQWKQAVIARVGMLSSGLAPEETEHLLVYSYQLENLDFNEIENIMEGIQQNGWLSRTVKFENMTEEVKGFLRLFPKKKTWNGVEFELDVCEDRDKRMFVSVERETKTMTFFTRYVKTCF